MYIVEISLLGIYRTILCHSPGIRENERSNGGQCDLLSNKSCSVGGACFNNKLETWAVSSLVGL